MEGRVSRRDEREVKGKAKRRVRRRDNGRGGGSKYEGDRRRELAGEGRAVM